ncbi:methylated-DNA--[protein]-cysteine S-methyltransferase [Burkholderiales bacterium]|nr:methylated-DNA--[protein]-cysteine S-methyltransferase [Burkholderiales bacterium]
MVSICQTCISAPFGYVRVSSSVDFVTEVELVACKTPSTNRLNRLAVEAREQIKTYLKNPNFKFDLPVDIQGSSYRKRVWSEILKIPVRETRTYGEIAIFTSSSARAVGGACGDNRLPLLIPCHRIVARSGLGGYMHASAGFSLKVKWWLLHHEAN